MSTALQQQDREVHRQVSEMLGRSAAFQQLPPAEREGILRNTAAIVGTLAQNRLGQAAGTGDPFAVPMEGGVGVPVGLPGLPGSGGGQTGGVVTTDRGAFLSGRGGATERRDDNIGPKKAGDFGTGIALGVQQTGELLREVNFPNFVAELIQGVFQAVVDASVQQMKAYGEMVQSVAMSLNDFRDQNVTENQARDHLVQKYPSLMQVNLVDGRPQVGPRPGADDSSLPDFKADLGIDEDISSLDPETIEARLVPAARNDLARSRQTLLATMLLMGINRIVVTDGKINAKLKFDFRARDSMKAHAQAYDYGNFGTTTITQSQHDEGETTGENYQQSGGGWFTQPTRSGESSRWSRGMDQTTTAPMILLQGQSDTVTQAEASASGELRGEVSLNFKTESVDLNKLASDADIFKLERVRSAGRGAPAPGGAPSGASTPAAPAPAPAAPAPAGAR
ncbi:MAG TPA: hypothetical protein VFS20_26880 [Longimicrobium sp.]|nr:hypothetical protein [Longimicrobium sp.]